MLVSEAVCTRDACHMRACMTNADVSPRQDAISRPANSLSVCSSVDTSICDTATSTYRLLAAVWDVRTGHRDNKSSASGTLCAARRSSGDLAAFVEPQ
jgi:hypothetical protein